jgi:hypothetical protein
MDFLRLEYIKNVNDEKDWAYKKDLVCSYFPLHFKAGDGVEAHAFKLPKGSLIILSQNPPHHSKRYLTHVVELCNEASEDKPQWDSEKWGIVRWAKVCWVVDFSKVDKMPIDEKVMQADWGWQDTKAKLLTSPNLMNRWGSIEKLREHLQTIFI